jgi:hypothetical protein
MIKPHDSGMGLTPITSDKEFEQLAKALFENSPGQLCSWDVMHEDVQAKWVGFAKFAYATIITAISVEPRPEDV